MELDEVNAKLISKLRAESQAFRGMLERVLEGEGAYSLNDVESLLAKHPRSVEFPVSSPEWPGLLTEDPVA